MDDQRGRQDLHLQTARRRVVLQRQEIHRRGRGLQLQAAQGPRDQGTVCLARRQHQGIARDRSLYCRVRTRGAVLRAAAAAHHVHQRDSQQGKRGGAGQGLRHQGRRRHRTVVFRELAAAHRDRAEAARRLQMGPVDVQEQGPGEVREAGHQDHPGGFQPGCGDDGRQVRRHPYVSGALHHPGQGGPDADGDRSQAQLPAALFRLQDYAADGGRQARARGHEHRHQPGRNRQGHPARQCRPGLHRRRQGCARSRSEDGGHHQRGYRARQKTARRSRLESRRRRRAREGRREAGAAGVFHCQRQLRQGRRRDPGISAQDRGRLAPQPVGLDHRIGQDGRAGLRNLVGDGALSVGRRPHEHLLRFAQHPDAEPDELEGRRDRRVAEARPRRADRARSRQILRAGAAEGDAGASVDSRFSTSTCTRWSTRRSRARGRT